MLARRLTQTAFLPSVRTNCNHSTALRLRECMMLMLASDINAYTPSSWAESKGQNPRNTNHAILPWADLSWVLPKESKGHNTG